MLLRKVKCGRSLLGPFVGLEQDVGGEQEAEAQHAAPDSRVGPGVDDTCPLECEEEAGEACQNEYCAWQIDPSELLGE